MSYSEYVWVQLGLDFLLFLGLGLLYLRFRKLLGLSWEKINDRLELLEKLSQDLSRYLEEEKKLYARLQQALAAGVEAWEKEGEGRRGLKEEILAAHRAGLSVREIARKFSVSEGEVELILSLERFKEKK